MKEHIEELKKRFHDVRLSGKGCEKEWYDLMRAVYQLPVVFTVLSSEDFDPQTKTSTPFICSKILDKEPTIYLFSDLDLAEGWMNHFHYTTADQCYGLIGAVEKNFYSQLSMYEVARAVGVKNIMLDEGGMFVWIRMEDFFDANGIDKSEIRVNITKEESDRMIEKGERPELKFSRIAAIPTMKKHD